MVARLKTGSQQKAALKFMWKQGTEVTRVSDVESILWALKGREDADSDLSPRIEQRATELMRGLWRQGLVAKRRCGLHPAAGNADPRSVNEYVLTAAGWDYCNEHFASGPYEIMRRREPGAGWSTHAEKEPRSDPSGGWEGSAWVGKDFEFAMAMRPEVEASP